MNKAEFVSALAKKSGVAKKDIEAVLKAYPEVVKETVASGDKISLVGFCTWEKAERAERSARNPQTGEKMTIPASKFVKASLSKSFKNL